MESPDHLISLDGIWEMLFTRLQICWNKKNDKIV